MCAINPEERLPCADALPPAFAEALVCALRSVGWVAPVPDRHGVSCGRLISSQSHRPRPDVLDNDIPASHHQVC